MMEDLKQALFSEKDNANNELRCVICWKCLSVPPIVYNSILGNICGRTKCNIIAKSKGKIYQQIAYESVAKFLKFPCMYRKNGCEAELKWENVQEHENSCKFMNFTCPFSKKFTPQSNEICNWVGENSVFLSHMEQNHTANIFVNALELNLLRDYTQYTGELFFTRIHGDIIIVIFYINEHKNILFCKVWADINVYTNLQYQIKFSNVDGTSTTSLRKKKVELLGFDFLKHNIGHDWLKIDLDNIGNFIEDPVSMTVEFEYFGFKIGAPPQTIIKKKLSDNFTSSDLREAKCDLCSGELIPPVFMCSLAHNICRLCKMSEVCTKCSSRLAQSRNIAFEKLKFLVNQQCKNHPNCDFKGPYPYIKNHEEECIFNSRKCILGCPQPITNLLQHLTLDHPLSISDLNVIYSLNRLKLHVFLFNDQIFLFTKKLVIDEGFSFSVECLGMKEVKYQYELRIINDKFSSSEIMLSHMCQPELANLKKFETDNMKGLTNPMLVPHHILEQMFPDLRSLKFKMRISEIGTSKPDE